MKKLFISQPMDGKTDEEILKVRGEAIKAAKEVLGEDIEVIDSFITDPPQDLVPLWYLGHSILLMAKAHIVYFAPGWRMARGCIIENMCACSYGLITIETP